MVLGVVLGVVAVMVEVDDEVRVDGKSHLEAMNFYSKAISGLGGAISFYLIRVGLSNFVRSFVPFIHHLAFCH